MKNSFHTNETITQARSLMETMVATSQKPDEGNERFVTEVGDSLGSIATRVSTATDPQLSNRSLLIADFGDPNGDQIVGAVSHSDVVGVDGQTWNVNPWKLTEENGTWYGRGVCDTHGSGVGMILAASQPDLIKHLQDQGKYVRVIFTYDEEASAPDLSLRGAKMAAGLLNGTSLIAAPFYIAGEPTELNGRITPMRSHKGRFLTHYDIAVDRAGHVSDDVQNAFGIGIEIAHETMGLENNFKTTDDPDATLYKIPHSTVQVTAARVKEGGFSTTPDRASLTIDMRTLPSEHALRSNQLRELIHAYNNPQNGVRVDLTIEEDAPGSMTKRNSPIVTLSEAITGQPAQGFNGVDEGMVFRHLAHKEGVTLGPGDLAFAHKPDEQIAIKSVLESARIYSELFHSLARLS